jgi:hypothetical protein
MDTITENILAVVVALPGLYGIFCRIRLGFKARKTARWVRDKYEQEWNNLHWLAKRNSRAGVEVLITKGLISGPEVEEYRKRDEYLEKATWIGLFITAVLLLVILALQFVASTFG